MMEISIFLVYNIYTITLHVLVTKYFNGDKWSLLKNMINELNKRSTVQNKPPSGIGNGEEAGALFWKRHRKKPATEKIMITIQC